MAQVSQRVLARGARRRGTGILACAIALLAAWPASAQKFYPDDPLMKEPPPLPVGKLKKRGINDYFDFFQNTFFKPDKEELKHRPRTPSQAVNTLDEVPDSAWFTNRIGSRPMPLDELVRGPGDSHPPADGPWTVISGKNEGITPGLVIRDHAGRVYFLKFDPKSNPDMASAADVMGARFFYALGYNTPENYIVEFKRDRLAVTAQSKYRDPQGHTRPMKDQDIDDVLLKVRPKRDGAYRGMASLTIAGEIIGPFRYYGTRSDDPNDVVSHENRRDLRGLFVFAAWLNHTDTKSLNSLDSVVEEDGVWRVKHYLIDFGAILGSDSFEAKSPRAGHVYLFDFKPAAWQVLSLGLYVPRWMLTDYPRIPEAGHLDYESFHPDRWKSNYPNPAFELRSPADEYWAAKKVMAFSDADIRAVVETAGYSDPRAVEWTVKCLVARRDRIGRTFFARVLPLDGFAVRDGRLAFEDLGVKYGFRAARPYAIAWSEFDNLTGRKTPLARAADFKVPRDSAEYLTADIRGDDPRKIVTVYLRNGRVIGVDRTW
jgi:hypothetical protein